MILECGATPMMWEGRVGGNGLRPYIGTVVARWNDPHPYVVWDIASDDGLHWDCFAGDYCEEITDALDVFAHRVKHSAGIVSTDEQYKQKEVA